MTSRSKGWARWHRTASMTLPLTRDGSMSGSMPICKERADDPTLRRSRCARHDAAVLHLHRRLQPALDVEPHPRAVRMMTDCLEQQLPIDTVEVAFDVDVEHPGVAPAALTGLAYGIDRRSAGPVAIG